jgi:hypothetical protein
MFDLDENPIVLLCAGKELLMLDIKREKHASLLDLEEFAKFWPNEIDCETCNKKSVSITPVEIIHNRREVIIAVGKKVKVIKLE